MLYDETHTFIPERLLCAKHHLEDPNTNKTHILPSRNSTEYGKSEMSQVALVMSIYCPKQKALDTVVTLSPASSLSQGQKHKGRVPAVLLTLPAPLTCSTETMCRDHCAKRRGHDVLFKASIGCRRQATSSHTPNRGQRSTGVPRPPRSAGSFPA